MNETQTYFIEGHVEDFRDGIITWRELVRRVGLIAGGAAAAATILSACDLSPRSGAGASPTIAAGTTTSSAFLSNLQKSFAAGLTVTVQPRPIETNANSTTTAQVRGTWKDAGQAQRSARSVLNKAGNTWYWGGVVLGL